MKRARTWMCALAAGCLPLTGNPWVYAATVSLPLGESITYRYDPGSPGTKPSRIKTITVTHGGQVVDDWVATWAGPSPGGVGTRPGFITGIYMPDLWTDSFLRLSASTFQRIKDHNAGQGSQFTSEAFTALLERHGVLPSLARVS